MRNIAIVGNDYPEKIWNASSFVDSCEIVVRFSLTPYYHTGLIGSKTDILIIRTDDSRKGKYIVIGKRPLVPEVYQQAKEFWFIKTKGSEQCKEFYNLKGKFVTITMKNINSLYEEIGSRPSSGIVAIDYILSNSLYDEHEKYLVAAGWNKLMEHKPNSKYHDWNNEIKYVQKHIEMGNLKRWEPMILL